MWIRNIRTAPLAYITCSWTCKTQSPLWNRSTRHRLILFSKRAFLLAEVTGQPSWILQLRPKEIEYPAYSRTNCELKCRQQEFTAVSTSPIKSSVRIVRSPIETALHISSYVSRARSKLVPLNVIARCALDSTNKILPLVCARAIRAKS